MKLVALSCQTRPSLARASAPRIGLLPDEPRAGVWPKFNRIEIKSAEKIRAISGGQQEVNDDDDDDDGLAGVGRKGRPDETRSRRGPRPGATLGIDRGGAQNLATGVPPRGSPGLPAPGLGREADGKRVGPGDASAARGGTRGRHLCGRMLLVHGAALRQGKVSALRTLRASPLGGTNADQSGSLSLAFSGTNSDGGRPCDDLRVHRWRRSEPLLPPGFLGNHGARRELAGFVRSEEGHVRGAPRRVLAPDRPNRQGQAVLRRREAVQVRDPSLPPLPPLSPSRLTALRVPCLSPARRSAIFYHNDAQKGAAVASFERYRDSKVFKTKKLYTEIKPAKAFWPAEEVRQSSRTAPTMGASHPSGNRRERERLNSTLLREPDPNASSSASALTPNQSSLLASSTTRTTTGRSPFSTSTTDSTAAGTSTCSTFGETKRPRPRIPTRSRHERASKRWRSSLLSFWGII